MDENKQHADGILQTENRSTDDNAKSEAQSVKEENKPSKKKARIVLLAILAIIVIITCIIPIKGCANSSKIAENAYRNAITYKDKGDYITAYNFCDNALSQKPHMKKAQRLKEELAPLMAQQKAEQEAKQKAEEEAKQREIDNAIQTLLSGHAFDGELAVKIAETYSGKRSGVYMYGILSYDANGNYYPVIRGYDYDTEYWERWFVYENGKVEEQTSVKSTDGYTNSTESEGYANAPAQSTASTPTPPPTQAPTQAPTSAPESNTANSSSRSSTTANSSVKLDQTYYGNGYKISYPSSYDKSEFGGILMIIDSDTGSNITVTTESDVGSIDGATKQDVAEMLSDVGLDVNITTFYDTTIDGYKCYVAEYALSDMTQTMFILGDGTDAYLLAATQTAGATDKTSDTLVDIIYSFDIT